MPITGFCDKVDNKFVTIITSAYSVEALNNWVDTTLSNFSNTITYKKMDLMDTLLHSKVFNKLANPVIILYFNSNKERSKTNEELNLNIVSKTKAIDFNIDMIDKGIYDKTFEDNTRTLEEIYKLKRNDKWDRRSKEEKQKEIKNKRKLKKLKKEETIKNPFDDPNGDSKHVQTVKVSQDGKVVITVANSKRKTKKIPKKASKKVQSKNKKLEEQLHITTNKQDYCYAAGLIFGRTEICIMPKKIINNKRLCNKYLTSKEIDIKKILNLDERFTYKFPGYFVFSERIQDAEIHLTSIGLRRNKKIYDNMFLNRDGLNSEKSLVEMSTVIKGIKKNKDEIVSNKKKNKIKNKKVFSPEEFAKALAGDRSSTMTGAKAVKDKNNYKI